MSDKYFTPRAPRRRTRLRSGKIVNSDGAFIIECQILSRSTGGALLQLVKSTDVPDECLLFDDEFGKLFDVKVIWRESRKMGVELRETNPNRAQDKLKGAAYSGKYYALRSTARD